MNTIETTSPAYDRSPVSGKNTLEELHLCGKINLRGDPSNPKFVEKTASLLGFSLPLDANTHISNDTYTVYWMGPDEWLIHCELDKRQSTLQSLKTKLAGIHSAAVDISDYFTVLKLQGPDASSLIRKSCPLDLHINSFPDNSCTQTRFGHSSILLHRVDSAETFTLQVRWSYTEYVWDYLVSGMKAL